MDYAAYAASGGGEYTHFPRRKLETQISYRRRNTVGRHSHSMTRYPLYDEKYFIGEIRKNTSTRMKILTWSRQVRWPRVHKSASRYIVPLWPSAKRNRNRQALCDATGDGCAVSHIILLQVSK